MNDSHKDDLYIDMYVSISQSNVWMQCFR